MLSVDTKNIFLIGGAAVAVLAGAYVIWGPSERKHKKGSRRGNNELRTLRTQDTSDPGHFGTSLVGPNCPDQGRSHVFCFGGTSNDIGRL